MMVYVSIFNVPSAEGNVYIDDVRLMIYQTDGMILDINFIVPNGSTYIVNTGGSMSTIWKEQY